MSLVTVGPGERAASGFGHSFMSIRDTVSGEHRAYTFGQSSFTQPGFVLGVLQGRADAGAGRVDGEGLLERYAEAGRTIWTQRLNLRPAQRTALVRILEEARGLFRYDFFRSNCTTKLRDALDGALGGRLRARTAGIPSAHTFRQHADRYMRANVPLHALSLLVLADPADRPISAWEEMFLPATLRERIREITVVGEAGEAVPLVAEESVQIASGQRPVPPIRPPPWPAYLLAGMPLGLTLGFLGWAGRDRPWARAGFSMLGGAWAVVAGLAGLALAALWAFTDYTLMYGNENLLLLSPVALLVALAGWGSWRDAARARWLALATAALALTEVVLKLLPAFDQANAAVAFLAIPAHLGLAWGMWGWSDGIRPAE